MADRDARSAGDLLVEIDKAGGHATFVETDAADADLIREMVDRAAALGSVTTLINNAGAGCRVRSTRLPTAGDGASISIW